VGDEKGGVEDEEGRSRKKGKGNGRNLTFKFCQLEGSGHSVIS